ncbi:hypothetical protein EJB10_00815 [Wolbachia endosymbiont of Brugia malayi]|uniref:GrpB family protein n=1 Tax=unclassified Wolbachia TaxID=2640676 RepID=UPI000A005285|nr:hypothetical protein EJB10_00815 [Wolbachia endosymbiont of Brugia malayi]
MLLHDYLRENCRKAKEYSELKYKLSKTFVENREAYTEDKAGFIKALLIQAERWKNLKE